MARVILFAFLVGASVLVSVAASPAGKSNVAKKRDVKPSEMEDILADDNKRKRSQEVIMFGNQQNKPAGMVDDVLVGFADKKSFKRDHLTRDDEIDDNDDNASDNPGGDESEDDVSGISKSVFDEVPPSTSLENSNSTPLALDARLAESSETSESSDPNDQIPNPFQLPSEYLRAHSPYQELDESTSLGTNDLNLMNQDWNDFGNRFYNGDAYRRRRRNAGRDVRHFHKRSLVTPIEQLMHLRSGGRWKRDLKLRDDDVVGLLGLLAAAEVAKERQEARHHKLEELESEYAGAIIEPEPSRHLMDPDDLALVADNYAYYSGPDDEMGVADDDDNSPGEIPDIVLYEPEAAIELRRRSGHFYPKVDYRSLGIIGQKKRSSTPEFNPRRTNYGVWGRLEERKRYPATFDDFLGRPEGSEEEEMIDEFDGGRGAFERNENKLYSLGELLKGSDPTEDNYPVYRRLI